MLTGENGRPNTPGLPLKVSFGKSSDILRNVLGKTHDAQKAIVHAHANVWCILFFPVFQLKSKNQDFRTKSVMTDFIFKRNYL
jgi:hypothetical protein